MDKKNEIVLLDDLVREVNGLKGWREKEIEEKEQKLEGKKINFEETRKWWEERIKKNWQPETAGMHLANLEMAIFCKKELTKRKSFGMEMVFQKAQSSVSCFREYGGELKLSEGMVLEIIDEMDLLEKEIVSLKNEIKKDVNDKKEELLNNFKNSTKSEEEKKLKKEIDKLEKLNEEKKKKFQEEIEKINTKKDDEIFLLKQEIEGLKNKLKNDNQQWLQNLKELTITEQMEDHQSITSSTEIISDFE